MKRLIVFAAVAMASVMGPSGGRAAAQAGREQLDGVESRVKANGIDIVYRSYGPTDRPAILLIMGVGGQLVDWPEELPALLVKRGYRVVTFDNRDAGLSTKFDAAGLPDWPAIFSAIESRRRSPTRWRTWRTTPWASSPRWASGRYTWSGLPWAE